MARSKGKGKEREREREIFRYLFGGNDTAISVARIERERGRSSGFHLFPSLATVLMPLGFLYQVLSLFLIRSDSCAFWFRVRVSFYFSQFDFLFVFFFWKFFQRFRLIDEDLNRGIFFFFWGLWIGLVWKIWDCYLLLILYGDEIRWSWNSVLFITTRVVVRFSLCHRNFYRIVKFWIVKFRYFVDFIN